MRSYRPDVKDGRYPRSLVHPAFEILARQMSALAVLLLVLFQACQVRQHWSFAVTWKERGPETGGRLDVGWIGNSAGVRCSCSAHRHDQAESSLSEEEQV
jgi:hypothetical protein